MTRKIRDLVLFAAAAALVSCTVDFAGILEGKECGPSGECASGYACEQSSRRCVPIEEIRPDAAGGRGDGGAPHADGGTPVDAGPHDGGPTDAGFSDTGGRDVGPTDDLGQADTGYDSGITDAGVADAGAADTGLDSGAPVCPHDEYQCVDKDLERCRGDGSGWDKVMTCDFGCLSGQCNKCTPGGTWCEGSGTQHTCAVDGQSDSTVSCDKGCNGGPGKCNVCTPNGQSCADKDTWRTCHGDGQGWDDEKCCVPGSCLLACDGLSPHIDAFSPTSANVGDSVTITIDGCQFSTLGSYSSVVQFMLNSQWQEPSNGSIVSRTGTQIQYRLENINGPGNRDFDMRVHTPAMGPGLNSNTMTFHVN